MNLKKLIVWLLSISMVCQSSMQVYPVKAIPDVILNPLYFEFANFFASKIPSVKEQSNLIASQTGVHSVNELPSCVSGQKTKIYFPLINNRNRSKNFSEYPIFSNTEETCADIISPTEGLIVLGESGIISVTGVVQPQHSGIRAKLVYGNSGYSDIDITGHFSFTDIILSDGENSLLVEFYHDNLLIGVKTVKVIWNALAEASAQITPQNGGVAEVTNATSEILGTSIFIPPGAAERNMRTIITTIDPEYFYNLPYGYVAVGPLVSFGPIGETFYTSTTIKIPVNLELFPQ